MSEYTLQVEERDETGKNVNRRLRAAGEVPAVVYGGGRDPKRIRVGQRTLEDLLKTAGDHSVFLLKLSDTGKSRHAMIRELQTDPITGHMIHVDFQRVSMDQEVRVTVPIEIHGEPQGVKTEGGFLDFVTRELEVECLPGKIPGQLVLDVSPLHIGQHVEASEIELPEGVKLLEDPERVIVSIFAKRIEEVPEEEEELLITAEGEEPEVIGQKAEDEDDEG